jgi:hypothetical protein
MSFKPLPKTTGEWQQTLLRSALLAALILLPIQLCTRLALSSGTRQSIEEILFVPALLLSFYLACSSVVAWLQRQRLLALLAVVIAIFSTLLAFLPMLLQEAIIN